VIIQAEIPPPRKLAKVQDLAFNLRVERNNYERLRATIEASMEDVALFLKYERQGCQKNKSGKLYAIKEA
jgi:hypothetical protein